MYAIIIVLEKSKNLNTISERLSKNKFLIPIIQKEKKNTNPTVGCYLAHMKALNTAINIMKTKKESSVMILEEDFIIKENLEQYNKLYSKDDNFILYYGGLIIENYSENNSLIDGLVTHRHCYRVNSKMAKKMIKIFKKSNCEIYGDGIITMNMPIKIIKRNPVIQIPYESHSNNTILNKFINYENKYIREILSNKYLCLLKNYKPKQFLFYIILGLCINKHFFINECVLGLVYIYVYFVYTNKIYKKFTYKHYLLLFYSLCYSRIILVLITLYNAIKLCFSMRHSRSIIIKNATKYILDTIKLTTIFFPLE